MSWIRQLQLGDQYKGNATVMRQKLRELAQSAKSSTNLTDSYEGILIVGRGKDHVTYMLLSNEVSNNSVSFDILPYAPLNNSTSTAKKGFFVGLGKKLGIIKAQNVITSADTSNSNVVGELSLDRTTFSSITLWKGDMNLGSGDYAGDWNMDLMSAKFFWWPNQGLNNRTVGQQDQGQPFAETSN